MFILQKAWQVVWVHQVVQKVFGSDPVTPLYFPSPLSIIFGFLLDFLALHPLQPIRQKIKKPSFWKNKEVQKKKSRVSFCLLVYLFKSVSSFKFIYIESTLLLFSAKIILATGLK